MATGSENSLGTDLMQQAAEGVEREKMKAFALTTLDQMIDHVSKQPGEEFSRAVVARIAANPTLMSMLADEADVQAAANKAWGGQGSSKR